MIWMLSANRTARLAAAVMGACSFVTPATVRAQSAAPIVLECTRVSFPGFRETITLNLAQKSAQIESITPVNGMSPVRTETPPATITEVTDQEITFGFVDSGVPDTVTYVLNRYTGQLHETVEGAFHVSYEDVCQREQKLF